MGNLLSFAYRGVQNLFTPLSSQEETQLVLNKLHRDHLGYIAEVAEFQIHMLSLQIISENHIDSFSGREEPHLMAQRKGFLEARANHAPELFQELIDRKNKLFKAFSDQRKNFKPFVTDQDIENVKSTVEDHITLLLIKNYRLTLMLIKCIDHFEEYEPQLKYIVSNDHPLDTFQKDLPILKNEFNDWLENEPDTQVTNSVKTLIDFLDKQLEVDTPPNNNASWQRIQD